jgi:hypothetical protein
MDGMGWDDADLSGRAAKPDRVLFFWHVIEVWDGRRM